MMWFIRDIVKAYKHHTIRSTPLSPLDSKRLVTAQRVFLAFAGTGLTLSAVGITKKVLAVREMTASKRVKRDRGVYAKKCLFALNYNLIGSLLLLLGFKQHFTASRLVKGGMFPGRILALGLASLGVAFGGPTFVLVYKHELLDKEDKER